MKIFNVYLTGSNINTELVFYFRDELLRLGKNFIKICTEKKEANMEVDISHLDATCNITDEAIYVISTAKNLGVYEKKRRKIIKKSLNKMLLASSNLEKLKNRKNVN